MDRVLEASRNQNLADIFIYDPVSNGHGVFEHVYLSEGHVLTCLSARTGCGTLQRRDGLSREEDLGQEPLNVGARPGI